MTQGPSVLRIQGPRVPLWAVQDVSCSGDTLANSAYQIDLKEMSRGERWQCWTSVLAINLWHNVRMTFQGGCLAEIKQD